jgi:hypothetical protein
MNVLSFSAVTRVPDGLSVDRLYQAAPGEFTRERNALAKQVGGEEGKRIRALARPSTSAWAVNQLYWHDRETYDELVAASERLRSAHRAVLAGRKGDLVGADAGHRDAVKMALGSTLRLVRNAGQNISGATHNEIAQTLENLSADDPAGQLAKPLHPEGFEALQGMSLHARDKGTPKPAQPGRNETTPTGRRKATVAVEKASEVREAKEARRARQLALQRERLDRAAVTRLQTRVAQAERSTEAAKIAFERAKAVEASLRDQLEQAELSLRASTRAARES